MSRFILDVLSGVASAKRSWSYSLSMAVALGLGIGAATTLDGVAADVVSIGDFPVADRLIALSNREAESRELTNDLTAGDLATVQSRASDVLEAVIVADAARVTVAAGDVLEVAMSEYVSPNYFSALRIRPAWGARQPDETTVLVSEGLWRRVYGAEPYDSDHLVRVRGRLYRIAGIVPNVYRGLTFPGAMRVDVWLAHASLPSQPGPHRVFALRRADTSEATARALLSSIDSVEPDRLIDLVSATEVIVPREARGMAQHVAMILTSLAGLLVIVVAGNYSTYLLAKCYARLGDVATYRALGATRVQIFRLLIAEAVMVCVMGGVVGVAVVLVFNQLIERVALISIAGVQAGLSPGFDVGNAAIAVGAAVLAAAIAGVLPAWRTAGTPIGSLAGFNGRVGGPGRLGRMQLALVGIQVIGAGTLTMVAGSVALAGRNGDRVPESAEKTRVAAVEVAANEQDSQHLPIAALVAAATDASDGGSAVVTTNVLGGWPGPTAGPMRVRQDNGMVVRKRVRTSLSHATPGWSRIQGMALLEGRRLDAADLGDAPPVAIVTATAAEALWASPSVVGRQIMVERDGRWRTVVGVIADATRLRTGIRREGGVVLPIQEAPARGYVLYLANGGTEAVDTQLRHRLASLVPPVVVLETQTLHSWLAIQSRPRDVLIVVTSILALVAFAVTVLGLFGLVAYLAQLRLRDVAVRLALGGRRYQVYWAISKSVVYVVVAGLVLGGVVATITLRSLPTALFGDDLTNWFAGGPIVAAVLGTAAVSVGWPLHRALRGQHLASLLRD